MIIDDDEAARNLLSRMLQKEGYRTASASGGREGLALAKELLPDAILLDVMMPEVDGWQVLTEIKKDPRLSAIPVIMETMLDESDLGFALGARDYFMKPVPRNQLVAAISAATVGREAPVLVVDDDDDLREILGRTLKEEGFHVETAANGQEALAVFESNVPCAVLLDLMMPVMDGFEFIRQIQKRPCWKRVPIVVFTCKVLTDRRAELAHRAGPACSRNENNQPVRVCR